MTVSTTATYNPTGDEVITTALRLCGVLNAQQPAKPEQLALGRIFLQSQLHALAARGVRLNAVERYTSTLTSGVGYVTAPADTVSIERGATVKDTNGNDYVLEGPVNIDTYQALVDKTVSGKPSLYCPEVNATNGIVIYLWPVPDSTYVSITYVRARLPRDVDTGAVTLDVPPKFMQAMQYAVAADFASHYQRESAVSRLASRASGELGAAMDTETMSGDLYFRVPRLIGGGF